MKPRIIQNPKPNTRRNFLKATIAGAASGSLATTNAFATTPSQLEGYASSTSVAPADTISFFVSNFTGTATLQKCSLTILRRGAKDTIFVNTTVQVRQEQTPALAYTNGCGWPARYTTVVPANWSSGLYVARLQIGTDPFIEIPFVVKAARFGSTANILVQLPYTTVNAYNNWPGIPRGGKSLYTTNSSAGVAATKVSFDRPFNGKYQTLFYGAIDYFMAWLETNNFKVEFCSSIDLHDNAAMLNNYQLLITFGHDEYWTLPMRNNVDSFVESGGNFAIFGANTCWWQARLESGVAEPNANRTLVCYKSASADPETDPTLKTVNWYALTPPNPENSTTGLSYRTGADWSIHTPKPNSPFVVNNAAHWVYAGAGVTNGTNFGGPYVGYETDALAYVVDPVVGPLPTGTDGSPHNFTILGIADASNWNALNPGAQSGMAVMGTYQNNGTVFNAGTISWLAALGASGSDGKIINTITKNVINKLSVPKTALQRSTLNVYRYHAAQIGSSTNRYYYSLSPFVNDGWSYDGVAFLAFDSAVSGAIPVYEYFAKEVGGGGVRYSTWTSANVGQGWTSNGIAYYAYPDSRHGGVPVYEYYTTLPKGGGTNFLYSTDATIKSGWTLVGVIFYVPAA